MIVAWHGEPGLKAAALERLREHQRLDQITQGVYWESHRGCLLGCLTHDASNSPLAAERWFGIEKRVGYWLEMVFEKLPDDRCSQWVLDSAESIPVGADLSKCHHHLAVWLLGPDSPLAAGNAHPLVCEAVARVRELHHLQVLSGQPAESAVWSAARSAARSAAWSAAWSAESAVWSAIAKKSLEIFCDAPVVEQAAMLTDVEQELCTHGLWCREEVAGGTR